MDQVRALLTDWLLSAWSIVYEVDWKGWQTLVAGLLALFAALIGAVLLWRQIRQLDRHQRDIRARQLDSSRAVLPLAVNLVMDYAERSARALNAIYRTFDNDGNLKVEPRATATRPEIPPEAMPVLREFIEAGQGTLRSAAVELLSKLQNHSSRLRSLFGWPRDAQERAVPVRTNVEDSIIDAAEIHAMCDELLRYARRERRDVRLELDKRSVARALLIMGLELEGAKSLAETLDRRYAEPKPRWWQRRRRSSE